MKALSTSTAFLVCAFLMITACGEGSLFDTLDNVDPADPAADAPIAIIVGPQASGTRSQVTLHGDQSYDPKGANVTFNWLMVTIPYGSSASLVANTGASTSFFADKSGKYIVTLNVTGNSGVTSKTVSHTIDILGTGENHAPVAILNFQEANALVILDGSQSYDYEGSPLSYSWQLLAAPPGSAAYLSSKNNSIAYLHGGSGLAHGIVFVVNDGIDIDIIHATVTPQ